MNSTKVFLGVVTILLLLGGGYFLVSNNNYEESISANITDATILPKELSEGIIQPLEEELSQGENLSENTMNPSQVIILTYHSIEPKPSKPESKTQLHYRITPENFEQQMSYLSEKNYHPITFAELVTAMKQGVMVPEKSIVLTFDDGWKNQFDYAAPILKSYNFPATFFIVSKSRNGGYMSWDQLKELVSDGFEIASHTETHAKLTTLDDQQLMGQLIDSKKLLEDTLGITITTLAYPYYAHDERVMHAVAEAGYSGARAGWGSFKNSPDHIFEFISQEVVNNPNPFSNVRLND